MALAAPPSPWQLDQPVFTPRQLVDPYATYRILRSESPVHRDVDTGELLVTRYRDVSAVLKNPLFSSRGIVEATYPVPRLLQPLMKPLSGLLAKQMLFSDPPDHTRLRGLANRAFTPRVVQTLRPRIQEIADELLDRAERGGTIDLLRDYAVSLPILVIAELLGVPARDRAHFKIWSDDLALFVGGSTIPLPLVLLRSARGVLSLRHYFRRLVRQRRRTGGGEDLLAALIAVEERGDTLTEDELLANSILLLAAGHETTTNLIGNGIYALLRHPEQLDMLRREPELIESAVNELLRYDPPVQWTARLALEPTEIAGYPVRAGQSLALGLASANHDPEQFADPERLNILRSEPGHLAFSSGIHFCLGAALAKLEAQIAIGTVLDRYPRLSGPIEPVRWCDNFTLRGLKSLRVRVT